MVAKTGLQIYKIFKLFCNSFQSFLGHNPGFSSHIPIRKAIHIANTFQNVPGFTIKYNHLTFRNAHGGFYPGKPPLILQIH